MKTKPRWIPEDSIPILDPKDNGIVYVYAIGERYAAIAYKGNSGNSSWHYSYRTLEEAHKKAQEFFAGLASDKERHAKWRAAANKPHSLKVGDIIANSWGYEQTNVDWYRVTRTSEHFVWLMPIVADVTEDGFMSGPSAPHVDTSGEDPAKWGFSDLKDGKETMHKASSGEYGNSVHFEFGSGSKWDGRPMYCSWYA
jgi:hypothetical protein